MRALRLSVALAAFAALTAYAADVDRVDPSISIVDIAGRTQHPFASGKAASLVFFVTTDCPISNAYAPEIRRICETYADRVGCSLDYVDPTLKAPEVAKHFADYGHGKYPATIDVSHTLVKAAGATVTPEALLIVAGKIAYRGRIDDKNAALGVTRPRATRADLRLAIDAVLAGKPVEEARTHAVGCFITPLEFFRK